MVEVARRHPPNCVTNFLCRDFGCVGVLAQEGFQGGGATGGRHVFGAGLWLFGVGLWLWVQA